MFLFDTLSVFSISAYLLIALITVLCAPKKDLDIFGRRSLLLILAGTILAYSAGSIWMFLLGWAMTVFPFRSNRCGTLLMASTVALAVGAGLLAFSSDRTAHIAAFAAIALAAILRKGIFPFHFWVPIAFEDSSLPALNLFLNSHLGAYLLIRFSLPLFPDVSSQALTFLGILAIFTAVYTSVLALVAKRPRRVLALLCVSQGSFILAGLENRNVEGITGALIHWSVVAFATTALLAVYRSLEARSSEVESAEGFLGLGFYAPRLAVFFAVAALALVGLPGTLGFVSEDLLFHGSLESHPLLGIGLPLATALNAITALKLIATLFLGRRGIHVTPIPDARPSERWALTLPIVVLVAGGLAPSVFLALRTPSAERIAGFLAGR